MVEGIGQVLTYVVEIAISPVPVIALVLMLSLGAGSSLAQLGVSGAQALVSMAR